MAYTDIFTTETRGMYIPPNDNHPQMIPDYWRPSPDEELKEIETVFTESGMFSVYTLG